MQEQSVQHVFTLHSNIPFNRGHEVTHFWLTFVSTDSRGQFGVSQCCTVSNIVKMTKKITYYNLNATHQSRSPTDSLRKSWPAWIKLISSMKTHNMTISQNNYILLNKAKQLVFVSFVQASQPKLLSTSTVIRLLRGGHYSFHYKHLLLSTCFLIKY